MKLRYIILAYSIGLCALPLCAQTTPESLVRDVLGGISSDFSDKNPKIAFHPTIAVLNIEESSDDAKKHRVADALYPLLESLLHRSTVFELVERKNLEAIIKEQELTLTGLTADGKVSLGGLKEAEYILKGSITELGDDIQFSLSLISVQDGAIKGSRTGTIPKSVLIAGADAFSAQYVSPYGIGLELSLMPLTYFPLDAGDPAKAQGVSNGIGVSLDLNYRLSRDWLIYFGGEYKLIARNRGSPISNSSHNLARPPSETLSLTDTSLSSYSLANDVRIDYSDMRNVTSFFVGGAWVLNLSKEVNLNFGANARMAFMTQSQTYAFGYADGASDSNPATRLPQTPVEITASQMSIYVEPQFKIQVYLNPRMTLNVGYALHLKAVDITNIDYVYAGQKYRSEWKSALNLDPQYQTKINPWIDPVTGKNLTYDFSAQEIFVSLGFYF